MVLDLRLMAVISLHQRPELAWKNRLAALVEGGVTCVQLREKDASSDLVCHYAEQVTAFLGPFSVPLIVNDEVASGTLTAVTGMHVGEGDMSPLHARQHVGKEKILGVSLTSLSSLDAYGADVLLQADPDYFGIGPIFPTFSKKDARAPLGIEKTAALVQAVKKPCVAIGGIRCDNLAQLMETGVAGVAAISSLWATENPKETAQDMRRIIDACLES